jgi:hypothetical protein
MDAKFIFQKVNEAFDDAVGQMAQENTGGLDLAVSQILGSVNPADGAPKSINVGILVDGSPSVNVSRLVKALNGIESSIAALGFQIDRVIAFDMENPPNKISMPKFNIVKLRSFATSSKSSNSDMGPSLELLRKIMNKVDIIFVLSDFELSDGDLKPIMAELRRIKDVSVFVNLNKAMPPLASKVPLLKSLLVRP